MIRKTVKLTFKSLIIFILLITAVSIVYLWLITKPHSLSSFTSTIEEALNESIAPYTAEFDSIEMSWSGWQQSPVVNINGLRIRQNDTLVFYSVETEAVLSFSQLLQGEINPVSVKFDSPEFNINRLVQNSGDSLIQKEEKFHLINIPKLLPGLFQKLELEEITIDDARLTFKQNEIQLPAFILRISREDSLTKIAVQSDLLVTGNSASLLGDVTISNTDSLTNMVFIISDLHSDVLGQFFLKSVFESFHSAIDINLSASLTPRDSLKQIDFLVTSSAVVIDNPEIYKQPVTFHEVSLSGKFKNNLQTVSPLKFAGSLGNSKIEMESSIDMSAEFPEISGTINFTDLPIDSLANYWPYNLEKNTRGWLVENLSAGIIPRLQATVSVGKDDFKTAKFDLNKLDLQIDFNNLSAKYYRLLPPIKHARGTARLSNRVLLVNLQAARFRESNVQESTILLEGIGGDQQNIIIDTYINGPSENIAKSVLDLGAVTDTTFKPIFTSGKAFSHLKMHFPLNSDLALSEYNLDGTCAVRGLNIENLYGLNLNDAIVNFSLKDGKLFALGTSKINDLPAALQWQQNLAGNESSPPIFTFDADADNSQLRRFGIPHIENFSGKSRIHLTLITKDSHLFFNGNADLTNNRFHSDYLGWRKNSGEPAVLGIKADKPANDSTLHIQAFQLTGPNMFVGGNGIIDISKTAQFSVNVDTLRFAKNSFKGTVTSNPYDGLIININGESMDLQPVIDNILFKKDTAVDKLFYGTRAVEKSGKTTVNFKAQKMYLLNNEQLKQVNGFLQMDFSQIIAGNISARLSGGETFLSFYPTKEKNNLHIKSLDGGALLRGFGIYNHVVNGDLSLSANVRTSLPAGPVEGTMTLKNYSLKDAPTMAKILSLAALLGEAGLLSNQGIPFTQMDAEFYMRDNIIHVKKSKMAGSALIMSANGKMDINNDFLDLKGVIYPLTTLNNILSGVPLIGGIASNVRVLGTSYEMNGTFNDANISVNPLSILLPGFLRDFGDLLVKDTIDTLSTN